MQIPLWAFCVARQLGSIKAALKRVVSHYLLIVVPIYCSEGSTYPVGSTVYQRFKCLVAKGGKAGVQRHHDCHGVLLDCKY